MTYRFSKRWASPSLSTRKEQENAIKIHPRSQQQRRSRSIHLAAIVVQRKNFCSDKTETEIQTETEKRLKAYRMHAGKEQENAIKIHPRIIKKLPQMASRGTLQAPSEPLGAPFGHTPYFKTLLDVIFCHFGSTLASLGAAFRRPLGLLSLSWTLQEPKIDEF